MGKRAAVVSCGGGDGGVGEAVLRRRKSQPGKGLCLLMEKKIKIKQGDSGGCFAGFERKKMSRVGAAALRKMGEDRFRVGFFCIFLIFQNYPPPLCKCWKPVFIGKKCCQVFQLGPSTSLFL